MGGFSVSVELMGDCMRPRKRSAIHRGRHCRVYVQVALAAIVLLHVFPSVAMGEDCGNPFENGVGPWDYNDHVARSDPSKIPIVESAHFTPKVERLIEGESQSNPAGDIDYTLRAIPNHHRALYAISRYELRFGESRWKTAKCYFERAVVFRPDDPTVRMLLGMHYAMRDNHEKAVIAYREAETLMPSSAELQYNLGLTLVELGEYEAAREAAIKAYDGGHPLPGLRRKLNDLGYGWE